MLAGSLDGGRIGPPLSPTADLDDAVSDRLPRRSNGILAGMEMVAVAYADWERAKSPPPAEVVKFAKRFRFKAFLLDTWGKDSKCLLDFLKPAAIIELVESPQS